MIGESEGVNALRKKLLDDEEFLKLGLYAFERLESEDGGLLVLDIGAGFLDAPSASAWFRHHTLVALLAPAEVVHRRLIEARRDERSFVAYEAQEFSTRRCGLCSQAAYTVNADCPTADELGMRFLNLLIGLLSYPC